MPCGADGTRPQQRAVVSRVWDTLGPQNGSNPREDDVRPPRSQCNTRRCERREKGREGCYVLP